MQNFHLGKYIVILYGLKLCFTALLLGCKTKCLTMSDYIPHQI